MTQKLIEEKIGEKKADDEIPIQTVNQTNGGGGCEKINSPLQNIREGQKR